MSAAIDERVYLSTAEALDRLADGERISVSHEAAPGVITSAMWDRAEVIEYIETWGAEEAGKNAQRFGYGLCVMDDTGAAFIQTKTSPVSPLHNRQTR